MVICPENFSEDATAFPKSSTESSLWRRRSDNHDQSPTTGLQMPKSLHSSSAAVTVPPMTYSLRTELLDEHCSRTGCYSKLSKYLLRVILTTAEIDESASRTFRETTGGWTFVLRNAISCLCRRCGRGTGLRRGDGVSQSKHVISIEPGQHLALGRIIARDITATRRHVNFFFRQSVIACTVCQRGLPQLYNSFDKDRWRRRARS
jgi:hypothetical protein